MIANYNLEVPNKLKAYNITLVASRSDNVTLKYINENGEYTEKQVIMGGWAYGTYANSLKITIGAPGYLFTECSSNATGGAKIKEIEDNTFTGELAYQAVEKNYSRWFIYLFK